MSGPGAGNLIKERVGVWEFLDQYPGPCGRRTLAHNTRRGCIIAVSLRDTSHLAQRVLVDFPLSDYTPFGERAITDDEVFPMPGDQRFGSTTRVWVIPQVSDLAAPTLGELMRGVPLDVENVRFGPDQG